MSGESEMIFNVRKYRTGYSLAAGGVTLCDNRVLVVHRAPGSGPGADTWALPGGFVERHESVHAAVQREVFEEAGVRAEVVGLIAAMNRVLDDENNTYLIFLLETEDSNVHADGIEVDDARFVTLGELGRLSRLQSLTRMIVTPILQGEVTVLPSFPHPRTLPSQGMLYAGEGIREGHERMRRAFQEGRALLAW
jgi:ADP-ribose pyrophosphatase YjhB (NUDIX family)